MWTRKKYTTGFSKFLLSLYNENNLKDIFNYSFYRPRLNTGTTECSTVRPGTPDPNTPASFVLFSSAKVLRGFRETIAEEFCNFDEIANFFLRVEIIEAKINAGMINSNNSAILFSH